MHTRPVVILLALLPAVSGCITTNHLLTGEVSSYQADADGFLLGRDQTRSDATPIGDTDVYSLRLASFYPRFLKENGSAELLVYVEIFDVLPDERQKLVKVLFREINQAEGLRTNMEDRLAFGPIKFSGNPIRIRFIAVELDGEENDTLREVLKVAASLGAAAQPTYAPLISSAQTLGDLFLALNQDDRELVHDFTLYPRSHSAGPYLEAGQFVLIKTENRQRYKVRRDGSLVGKTVVVDEHDQPIAASFEDYADVFEYFEDEDHPFNATDTMVEGVKYRLQPIVALRVLKGELYLQVVGLEVSEFDGGVKGPPKLLWGNRYAYGLTGSDHFADPTHPDIPDYDFLVRDSIPIANHTSFGLQKVNQFPEQREWLVIGDYELALGRTIAYREKTHAVFTVARGGVPALRTVFEEMSAIDASILDNALQDPVTADLVKDKLAVVSENILGALLANQLVAEINAGFDDAQRITGDYPLAFLSRLDANVACAVPGGAAANNPDAIRSNTAAINLVRSITVGFPHTSADACDPTAIGTMTGYTAANFVWNANTGKFRFN